MAITVQENQSGQTCSACTHWARLSDNGRQLGMGECRAQPPAALRENLGADGIRRVRRGSWPATAAGDYCGSFQSAGE